MVLKCKFFIGMFEEALKGLIRLLRGSRFRFRQLVPAQLVPQVAKVVIHQ